MLVTNDKNRTIALAKSMKRLCRRVTCFFACVCFCINTFSAAVSDNDGAAFITKAEFDSLKNTFQSEIDRYNNSLDNKIESAISSYIGGVKAKKQTKQDNLYNRFGSIVRWTDIPIKSVSLKYQVKSFSAIFFQGDGYSSSNMLLCRFMSGNTTSTSSGTGTYNLFTKENDVKYYYGYVSGEYCTTNYVFSGVFMFSGSSIDGKEFPSSTVNGSRDTWPDSSSYVWNGGGTTQNWYTSDPNTSGWGNKQAYWSRSDSYNNGTTYNYVNYMSSGSISSTANRMLDFNNRVGGYSESGARTDFRSYISLSYSLTNAIMYNGGAGGTPKIKDDHAYFYPQSYDVAPSNLYSWAAYTALGRNIYLYQGLPLFNSSVSGTASTTFTLYTSNSSAANVTFYLRDNSFFSNGTPSGNQVFKAWRVNGSTKTLIGNNVTSITVPRSTKVEIEFSAKKDHEYIFKLAPSSTSYYAYISDFDDIIVTES